jgi:hypothetical protein
MSTIIGTPTLDDVRSWLGLDADDHIDDVVLQESLNAALAQQRRICVYPCDEFGDPAFDDDLREAIFLRTQRLAARRNSPEGVVGLVGGGGDFVSARVPAHDGDITALEAPHRKIPVA